MKKAGLLLLGVGVVFAVVTMRKQQSTGPKPTIWQKMQEGMEAMPVDFPPRVMFDNIEAVKENTDRILEMLSDSRVGAETETGGV